jgi:cell division protein FtsQ
MAARRRSQARPRGPTWRERFAALLATLRRVWRGVVTLALWVGLVVALGLVGRQVWLKLDSPVESIVVEGANRFVPAEQVQATLAPLLGESLWQVDLERMQARLMKNRWLTGATLTRQWPGRLRVVLSTHRPLARWGEDALMSRSGEIFRPKAVPAGLTLPVLSGPPGSQWSVWERYSSLRPVLDQAGLELVGVELSSRGALVLHLASGAVIHAGRESLEARLQRLLDVYPDTLAGRKDEIRSIDLRYSNGFAVAWREPPATGAEE